MPSLGLLRCCWAGSVLLFYTRHVVVKMLPFDNKSELQLVIDMPEGTTLEETARVTQIADAVCAARSPRCGTIRPMSARPRRSTLTDLVRHYYLREQPHEADIQINLVAKDDGGAKS